MGLFDIFGARSQASSPPATEPPLESSVNDRAQDAPTQDEPTQDDPTPDEPTQDSSVQAFAEALIRQSVGLMSSDAQAHLQGMEQIYAAAMGRALALMADQATMAQGTAMLAQITAGQAATTKFVGDIAGVAASFSKL